MNISETTRHALAIAEAVCRMPWVRLHFEKITFEVKPLNDVTYAANVRYREMEVRIKHMGQITAYLNIILVEQQQPYIWNTAFIEYLDAGSMCGGNQLLGRRVDGVWSVHNVTHVARSSPVLQEMLDWSHEFRVAGKIPARRLV